MAIIKIYDTTLRDGTQAEDISLMAGDKVRIARKLDEFGIHYIEGGWPGSNPKDMTFFKQIKKVSLKRLPLLAAPVKLKTRPKMILTCRQLLPQG